MRVTNEQALSDKVCELYCPDCELAQSKPEDWKCPHGETHVRKYAADLLEARALIKELSDMMLEISQYSIASVCEEVRQKARNEWERARDFV